MLIYRCPKCGEFLTPISTASIPPIEKYFCLRCGYVSKEIKVELNVEDLPDMWKEEEESALNRC